MIDFACKRFNLDEIIKCGLGLTKSDYKIMRFLVATPKEMSSENVAKGVGVDLSTAQRSLKKLRGKELINRQQKNLSPGGYSYFYRGKTKAEIRKIILGIVSIWAGKVEGELERW